LNLALISLLTAVSTISNCCPDQQQQFSRTFTSHGREYEVRFLESPDYTLIGGYEGLVMRWRKPGGNEWHVVGRMKDLRLEREVRLMDQRGREIDALVVSAAGGSAQFISVIEIRKNTPSLKVILDSALDKDGFKYRYDNAGRLIGFKFEYQAWHVSPDGVSGHVYTAQNIGWVPSQRRFRTGVPYVDDEREERASLLDVLTAIGSDELLGMTESHDEGSDTYTYVYKPVGLLWRKTPPELRSAKKIRVVIDYSPVPEHEPRIVEIGPVDSVSLPTQQGDTGHAANEPEHRGR
jgi:hypothetical protein